MLRALFDPPGAIEVAASSVPPTASSDGESELMFI